MMKAAPASVELAEGAKQTPPNDYSTAPHPYLERKGIDLAELQTACDCLLEIRQIRLGTFSGPALFRQLMGVDGIAHGYERILSERISIDADSKPNDKFTTKGGKVAGTFTPIGFDVSTLKSMDGRLIVCAGLADGYRLHEATQLPVACGVGEANIPGNIAAISKMNPNLKMIAAVDNDKAGKLAGAKSGCSWTCPQSAKDWSDVYQESGSDAVHAEYQEGMLAAAKPQPESKEEADDEKQAQSDKIVSFVQTFNELFHDDNDTAYARHMDTGEVRPLAGKAFRHWLTAAFYEQNEKAVRDQSLREARMTLEGIAMQDHRPVYIRVASIDGNHYLDLAEPGQSATICLMPGKWSIQDAPVMFSRSDSSQALPRPVPGGDISQLWKIANVMPSQQILIVAWLVECLRTDTPFPILEMFGEQGCAKSTTQTAFRRLIDPNAADLRAAPKSAEDLYVTGGTNHFISLENISHLPAPIQDALCVIATGGGFAKRKLYSDSEEIVITLKRPAILNGIVAAITQQDAVSRAISIELPVITNASPKNKLDAEYEKNRASIIGGLLDIAAKALEYLPEMTLPADQRPRLVEFAYLGMAVAKAMNEPPEVFMEQFNAARQDGLERTLDASPVASAIRDWAETNPGRIEEHPVKHWLNVLEDYKPRGCDSWPRSPKGLGDAMRRAAPALRQLGIECKCLGKIGSTVKWCIGQRKSPNQSRQCLEVVHESQNQHDLTTSTTSDQRVFLGEGQNPEKRRVF
jgi:hypothetical protein